MDLLTLAVALKNGGGGGGGSEVTVDPSLSPSSPNPVRNSAIYAALDGKADKTDLNSYATDDDVADAIQDAIGDITRFEYYLCGAGEYDAQGVPTVANPDTNHIYLTPTSGTNLNMYAYINNAFTFLGTTEVNLDGYATQGWVQTQLDGYATDSDIANLATKTEVNAKASSADLASVAFSGAYSDLSGKPSLATVATSGSYNDLSNKPALKTVATSGSYNDLSNKPTIHTVPSNLTLGKKGGTNTQLTINVIDSGTPASGTPDTTITFVKG